MKPNRRKGATMVEFSLAGIPAIFLLISAVDMALGMWQYHTLAYSMKEGTRYAAVRGVGCTLSGNTCSATVGAIATNLASMAIGIPPAEMNIKMISASGAVRQCNPITACYTDSSVWPPSSFGDNLQGKPVTITGTFLFHSPLSVFWPGTPGATVDTATFSATSSQAITF